MTLALRAGRRIVAVDPGPTESAWVLFDGRPLDFRKALNEDVLRFLGNDSWSSRCIIEKVTSYGMPVGEEIFETVYWCGRFAQAYGADRVIRIPRREVKLHLCNNVRAKDTNIRQALIDIFGPPGTKANPGTLYGVKNDVWSAVALGVTYWDMINAKTL